MPEPSLKHRLHRVATATISSRHENPIVRGLARVSRSYLDLSDNHSYDPRRNGELRVIEKLCTGDMRCIFDVGANEGDWILGVAPLVPHAALHCFELVPDTAAKLAERTYALGDRVHINAVGLSDAPGTVDVRIYPGFSEGASAAGFEHPGMLSRQQACEVIAGDAYCEEHAVERIDLLKIDTEGLDLQVLRGFDQMLSSGAVGVVQFEYGLANISSRAFLADFHTFLEEREFVVGKIWPRAVAFREYNPRTDENFRGRNYLAVHRQREDLITRLSAR